MINKLTLIALVATLWSIRLSAQSSGGIQGVVPPTPNAYQMTSFIAQRPNLYTGTANISIPLYQFNFEGMTIPISLTYDASGVRVNQEASEVGLGWALNATAVISRSIEGKDDLSNGSGANAKGYVYADAIPASIAFNDSFWQSINFGTIDTQPDVFHYNFFGYSGSFTLEKEVVNSAIPVRKMNHDNVEILFDKNAQTFEIITPNGFTGTFSVKEKTTSISGVAGGDMAAWKSYSNYPSLTGLQNSGRYRNITSWYIEKIEAPNGKELLFQYDLETDGRSKYVSITQPSFGETQESGGVISTPVFRTIQENVYLKKISINNELDIDFNMEDRYDLERFLAGGNYSPAGTNYIMNSSAFLKRYTSIDISGLGLSTFSREIRLGQSYFSSEFAQEADAYQHMRGRLDQVTIEDQVYRFQYEYGDSGLPNKSNWGIDNYGYYLRNIQAYDGTLFTRYLLNDFSTTSPQSTTFYQATNVQSDFDKVKIGTLTRVYYPTGGYSEYEYELHEYYVEGNSVNNGSESIDSSGQPGNAKGGGLRLKSQGSYTKENVLASKTSYQYLKQYSSNQSSGKLMTPLWYYFYWDPDNEGSYFTRFISANEMLAVNTAQGKNIGYSRVIERYEGVGNESFEKIYEFENTPTLIQPDWSNIRTSASYSALNGQIKKDESKNALGTIVEASSSTYSNSETESVEGLKLIFENGLSFWFRYKVSRYFTGVIQKVTTKYQGTGAISQTTNYTYNNKYQLYSEETTGSNGRNAETIYRRSHDIASPYSSAISEMKLRNIIEPPIEVIQKIDDEVVSAQGNLFELDASNLIILRKSFYYNRDNGAFSQTTNGSTFDGGYELQNHFTKYDSEGRLLEAVDEAGTYTSLIWGHNNTLPVVKGDGITHTNLSTAYTASQGVNFETNIRNHANTASGFVTTYDHNPYVGVATQTDPNQMSSSYDFDTNERLRHVKDNDGNIVQQYEYHFEGGGEKSVTGNPIIMKFGLVPPGESSTKIYQLTNSGNSLLGIAYVDLPTYFNTSHTSFSIAPGETYNLPITLSAPGTPASLSGTAEIRESSSGPSYLTFNITAEVDDPMREMTLPSSCAVISYPFSETSVIIQNTGNDYLDVTRIEVDSGDVNDGVQVLYSPSGEWRQGGSKYYELPLYIAPGSNGVFRVRYTGSTNITNWDGLTAVRIYSNSTNGYPSTYDATVNIKRNCN